MTNDFVYDMSEINEEEIVKGWEDADYISGLDDGEWMDDLQGEEDFA